MFAPCLDKHIVSIREVFDCFREVCFFQIKNWFVIDQTKPFDKHIRKCLKMELDYKRMNNFQLIELFRDYNRLFRCKKCSSFGFMSCWKFLIQVSQAWLEVCDILFVDSVKDLPPKWIGSLRKRLTKFGDKMELVFPAKQYKNHCFVEITKSARFADAKVPPFRMLSDRALK
eukprot:UN25450